MENSIVILVTGSSNGFGRLAATALARKGHRVFASMRNADTGNAEARDGLRGIAETEGISLDVVDLDVSDDDSATRGVGQVMD